MKKILWCLLALASCDHKQQSNREQYSTAVAVVIDFTDRRAIWPADTPTLALFACKQHPDAACSFNLYPITDKKINPVFSSYLQNGAATERLNTEDDVQFRNKRIVGFYRAVGKNYADCYRTFDTTKSFAYSEVWATICTALEQLAKSKCKAKYLIINSDLMERSDICDAYHLSSHITTADVAKKLNNAYKVPAHSEDIQVIFLFRPRTRAEDKQYTKMLEVYKVLLQNSATAIQVQANNTNYQ